MPHTVSLVIPVFNGGAFLNSCLEHLSHSTAPYECIVVDDGSTDDSAEIARRSGAKVIPTAGRWGPARARNLGAKNAAGDILFFIDSDVCVSPDTIERVLAHFDEDRDLDALIGSYDDSPGAKDFLSQYRNLMHCYTHQRGQHQASTFWSGCGAIRKDVFLEYSGFDESYDRPAIEDIELGYRLKHNGKKLMLDPALQVKHLKAWSFFNLVKTDVMDRGIPWTELILRDECLPNDLNLQLSQRVSVVLAFLVVAVTIVGAILIGEPFLAPLFALLFLMLSRYEASTPFNLRFKSTLGVIVLLTVIVFLSYRSGNLWIAPPAFLAYGLIFFRHRYAYKIKGRSKVMRVASGVFLLLTIAFVITCLPNHPLVFGLFAILITLILLNSQFYLFLARKRGRLFALAAIPFNLMFHFYNGVSFAVGMAKHHLQARQRRAKSALIEAADKSAAAAPRT